MRRADGVPWRNVEKSISCSVVVWSVGVRLLGDGWYTYWNLEVLAFYCCGGGHFECVSDLEHEMRRESRNGKKERRSFLGRNGAKKC